MEQLTWQYPSWYLIFCVALGILAAIALYRRDSTFQDQPARLRYGMAFLRGIVVTLLAALLLAPLLKLLRTRTEPPVILMAQDVSTSIRQNWKREDSLAYAAQWQELKAKLEEKYQVQQIAFGEEVRPTDTLLYADKASDPGQLMDYLQAQYRGQNVGAVIVSTDGAYNRGKNPLYVPLDIKAPVHMIALGDTVRKSDLQIKQLFYNSLAYLGDRFTLQVDISAMRLAGNNSAIEIRHVQGNQTTVLERKAIVIPADPFFETHDFIIEPKASGVQHYRVALTNVKNEVTYANNVRDFFVEVIDGRLSVLLAANSPHPDIAVLKNALLAQRNYEVEVVTPDEMTTEKIKKADLIILHQLPSAKHPIRNPLDLIQVQRTPLLFVVGGQTDLNAFNQTQNLLRIDQGGNQAPNEVTMIYNNTFGSFTVSELLKNAIGSFSPLLAPYGEYTTTPSAQVVAFQRIGRVDTQFPLIVVGENQEQRISVIAGEGIWKWQLYDQLQHGSKEITHELVHQLSQYASTKADKRKFRVQPSKKLYSELEDISFLAELYNDNYEAVTTAEVTMRIRNEERNEFEYTMSPGSQTYALDIGRFPSGHYTYVASTDFNGERLEAEGRFLIQEVQLEALSSTADHELLRQMAGQYGGTMVYPYDMASLADKVLSQTDIKPVLYSSTQTRPLIHLKWVCLFLILALSLEWFLRRFYGGY